MLAQVLRGRAQGVLRACSGVLRLAQVLLRTAHPRLRLKRPLLRSEAVTETGGKKSLMSDYGGSHNKFSMIFPLLRPKWMTKLPPLCSPRCLPLLTLCSPPLPERSPSFTVDPPPAPICPSTLDDGTHFGSRGFPFVCLPFQ
jgi:hypothetical protein